MPAVKRRGFTIIELLAGLAIVGFLFGSMLLLVDQLRDGRDRLLAQSRRDNSVANGMHVLRDLFARAEAGADATGRFTGDTLSASFATWCDVPGGWLERCSASLLVVSVDDSTVMRAQLSTGERFILIAAHEPLALRYFEPLAGGSWVMSWGASAALPAAVEVVVGRDTVVMRVGGRG
jgi:prepilin-type N-terminal cleavage/methylation domain-containing protein